MIFLINLHFLSEFAMYYVNCAYRRSDFWRRDVLLRRRRRVAAGRGVLGVGAEVVRVQMGVAVVVVRERRERGAVVGVVIVPGDVAIVVVAGNELRTPCATRVCNAAF